MILQRHRVTKLKLLRHLQQTYVVVKKKLSQSQPLPTLYSPLSAKSTMRLASQYGSFYMRKYSFVICMAPNACEFNFKIEKVLWHCGVKL